MEAASLRGVAAQIRPRLQAMASTPKGASRRATAQDVANLAGVSRSSVSLVLNGHADGNVSAVKQRLVLEAARQLDYRPNALALSLRSQRTWTVGVLTWRGVAGFPQEILHAGWTGATGAGYLTMLMDTPDGIDPNQEAVRLLLDRQVDGLVVVAPELTAYAVPEELVDTPLLLINCFDPDGRVTSIVPDELGAGATAAQLLVDQGHKRISLLSDRRATAESTDRITGVRRALAAAGLSALELVSPRASSEDGFALVRDALRSAERPTAVVSTRERLALGALLAARADGLDVPNDLSVVSLDDGEGLTTDLVPAIATIQRPDRAMAEEAVSLMGAEIRAAGEHPPRHLSFVCPVFLGGSVAGPSAR